MIDKMENAPSVQKGTQHHRKEHHRWNSAQVRYLQRNYR